MVSPRWIKHKQSFPHICQSSLVDQGMLDTHRRAIWRAVASGSVHQAAADPQYIPVTISQHIIGLQAEVGLPLYERKGRGIVPTPVGVRLAEESGEVFSSLRRLESTLEDLRLGPRPRLEIGCFSSAAKEWIPAIVSSVVTEFPTAQFEISRSPTTDAEDWHPHDLESHSEVDYLLVASPDHRLADAKAVSMSELDDKSWVGAEFSTTPAGLIITRACNAADVGVSALPPLAIRTLPEGGEHGAADRSDTSAQDRPDGVSGGALDDGPDGFAAVAVADREPRPFRSRTISVAPAQQGDHHRIEIKALRRESILLPRPAPRLTVGGGLKNVRSDKRAEPIGEHRIGDAEVVADRVEAANPVERLPEDGHRPLLSDDIADPLDRTLGGVEFAPVHRLSFARPRRCGCLAASYRRPRPG